MHSWLGLCAVWSFVSLLARFELIGIDSAPELSYVQVIGFSDVFVPGGVRCFVGVILFVDLFLIGSGECTSSPPLESTDEWKCCV